MSSTPNTMRKRAGLEGSFVEGTECHYKPTRREVRKRVRRAMKALRKQGY